MDDANRIHLGAVAPDFVLPDQSGKMHTLSGYRGRWVFLFFYTTNEMRACATVASMIRDRYSEFQRFNVQVFGISTDSVGSHAKFATKYNVPFFLLSDARKRVTHAYGAFVHSLDDVREEVETKSLLIDVMGEIERIYKNIKPKMHIDQVLKDLATIKKECDGNSAALREIR